MVFVAFGLNHKTAPISVRERIALSPSMQDVFLQKLVAHPEVAEAMLLSTCNRTEIYCETSNPELLCSWFTHENQIPEAYIKPHTYCYQGEDAVRHVLEVACGLDSMMLGEPQILGQLKQAYQDATRLKTIKHLRAVFEFVFCAAKRIRTQSGIGENPVSVAYAGVQLINKSTPSLKQLNVFLIGSGETASLVAKYLKQMGVKRFTVASRTLEHAQQLAQQLEGIAIDITQIPEYLAQSDVVISATSCPLPFINKKMVAEALRQRANNPMMLLDLAVPRDIEPEVRELDHITLFNVDDLQQIIDKGMEERRRASELAHDLISDELKRFARKYRAQKANHVITNYRSLMQDIANRELERALGKISSGHCHQRVLNEFSERLLNKLTHKPTIGLKEIAGDDKDDLLNLAQYLFNTTAESATYEEIS